MVVRIAVQDIEASKGLVQELVGVFGGPCVSFKTDGEILVEHAPDESIGQVLDCVERRLRQFEVSTASVWVDGRSYMFEHSQPRRLRPGKVLAK
jgi:hypothetical protein